MKINELALGFVLYNPRFSFYERLEELLSLGVEIYIYDNSNKYEVQFNNLLDNPSIIYKKNHCNEGLGKGLFDLANLAHSKGKKALLFFDQDTILSPETVMFAIECTEIPSLQVEKNCAILFNDRKKNLVGLDPFISTVDLAINSGTMFYLDELKNMGWHDPSFFVDGVDYEFCLKCKNSEKVISEVSNTPGFDHTTEQDDLTYRVFGKCLRMRAYPYVRVKDYLWSSSRLIIRSITTLNFIFAFEIIRQLVVYVLSQFFVRVLDFFGLGNEKST